MLRLTEIKLPLDHAEDALKTAILERLNIKAAALRAFSVFKRSYDARKRDNIYLIYTVDVDVADEVTVLKRNSGEKHSC